MLLLFLFQCARILFCSITLSNAPIASLWMDRFTIAFLTTRFESWGLISIVQNHFQLRVYFYTSSLLKSAYENYCLCMRIAFISSSFFLPFNSFYFFPHNTEWKWGKLGEIGCEKISLHLPRLLAISVECMFPAFKLQTTSWKTSIYTL